MELKQKAIWITGASSGIGESLAIELARRGARVAVTARRGEALEKIVAQIQRNGGEAVAVPADVTNLPDLKSAAIRVREAFGSIDMLIANAGIYTETWPERFDSVEYLNIMQTNFGGMLHSIEAVVQEMLTRKSGTIVAVASVAGYRGLPRAGAYGASKAAMIHFLESIRFHLREKGLRVVIVNPGFVRTRLTAKNDFSMPFIISPEIAANYIADGLAADRNVIVFPKIFGGLLAMLRVLPFPLYDYLVNLQWKRMPRQ